MLCGDWIPVNADQVNFEIYVLILPILIRNKQKKFYQLEILKLQFFILFSFLGGKRPDSDWIPVHADQEYVFEMQLSRINKTRVRMNFEIHFLAQFHPFVINGTLAHIWHSVCTWVKTLVWHV